jgi:hypothetical protein
LPADYAGRRSTMMHLTRKVRFAAYIILAMMDVLSTVLKMREHTAHVRIERKVDKSRRYDSFATNQSCQKKSMDSIDSITLKKIPLTMVKKSAKPQM